MTETVSKTPQSPEAQAEAVAKKTIKTAQGAANAAAAAGSEAFEGLDMAVPEVLRSLAEKTVGQVREAYERSKDVMEDAVETLERSIDRAGQGAVAFNRKVLDITQANVNTGFDFARDLAGAKTLAQLFELQAAYARRQFEALTAQAEDIRSLSVKVASEAAEPIKAHVSRSVETVRRAG